MQILIIDKAGKITKRTYGRVDVVFSYEKDSYGRRHPAIYTCFDTGAPGEYGDEYPAHDIVGFIDTNQETTK